MKIKNNIWHIVWIGGIYIVLIAILLLIIEYKVKWENKDLNTYLYFYSCSGKMCTTTEKVSNYYSNVKCDNKICPYVKELDNNLVILANREREYVYNFRTGKIINNEYINYQFRNDSIIVKNTDNKYGVIDLEGNILIEPQYNKIIDYKNGYLAYSENEKVGITSNDGTVNITPTYENVIIINEYKYGYLEDNKYYIAGYDTELPVNNTSYDYIYAIADIIMVFKDNKIDIITDDMESKLLLKIDTKYTYTKEEERSSLDIYKEGNLLHFSVVNDSSITKYVFDLKNKKLFY